MSEAPSAKYLVEKELGRGATSRVFLARQPSLARPVVLKLLNALTDGEARERFMREAQLLSRLAHPRVVKLLDFGVAPHAFLVYPFVDGRTLREVIRQSKRLRWQEACTLMRGLCDGLAHVHARGVVHRDLKPANVLVEPDGQPTLIDFGFSWGEGMARLTEAWTVVGTLPYIAPEQFRNTTPRAEPDTDATGDELLTMALSRDREAGAAIAAMAQRGTGYQRWVAAVCGALEGHAPAGPPLAPVPGHLTQAHVREAAHAFRMLPRVLREPRAGRVWLLDPAGPALATGVAVRPGDAVTIEWAGLGSAATTQDLVMPPRALFLEAQVGMQTWRVGHRAGNGAVDLTARAVATDAGTLVLRAGYAAFAGEGGVPDLRAQAHPGLALVRVEVGRQTTKRFPR